METFLRNWQKECVRLINELYEDEILITYIFRDDYDSTFEFPTLKKDVDEYISKMKDVPIALYHYQKSIDFLRTKKVFVSIEELTLKRKRGKQELDISDDVRDLASPVIGYLVMVNILEVNSLAKLLDTIFQDEKVYYKEVKPIASYKDIGLGEDGTILLKGETTKVRIKNTSSEQFKLLKDLLTIHSKQKEFKYIFVEELEKSLQKTNLNNTYENLNKYLKETPYRVSYKGQCLAIFPKEKIPNQ